MIPNIIPFLAINNMLSMQRSSYRSSHRHSNISSPGSSFDSCMPSQVFARCSKNRSDFDLPEFDLDDYDEFGFNDLPDISLSGPKSPDELDNYDNFGFNDLPDISLTGPTGPNEKELPYNLLFEIYRLGLTHGVGCIGGHSENIQKITSEMNKLAKKFGYNGYEDFDRFFDENENVIK